MGRIVGVITYDYPHRKTQDVLGRLLLEGYDNITLIALPYEDRPKRRPLIEHRPPVHVDALPNEIAVRVCMKYLPVTYGGLHHILNAKRFTDIIIAGAGILPKDVCDNHRVINSHPGYLPYSRGLDAMKWAIYNNVPIGATAHVVTEEADNGPIVEKSIVPVYYEDTFHSVAQRLYETEISLLVNSIGKDSNSEIGMEKSKVNKRMPQYKERIMLERFDAIRKTARSIHD